MCCGYLRRQKSSDFSPKGRIIVTGPPFGEKRLLSATIYLGIAPDDNAGLASALARGLDADVLLVTGGVSVGEYDLVGRFGGEEFLVILPDTSLVETEQLAQRIWERVGGHRFDTAAGPLAVTVSIGYSSSQVIDRDCDDALRRADEALYAAKNAGRNRVSVL